MKKINFLCWMALVCLALLTQSCSKDKDTTADAFSNGIFILNEGQFQTGTGTLDFYDLRDKTVSKDVFGAANGGQVLGNIGQSLHFLGDTLFIVVNNANKVVLANRKTMTYIGEINNLPQARFIRTHQGKAYVSCWGDGFSGSLHTINLQTLQEENVINNLSGPERMIIRNGQLWVTLSGGFGRSQQLGILDLSTGDWQVNTNLSDMPRFIVEGQSNEQAYILCSGFNDFAGTTTPGAIWRIQGTQSDSLHSTSTGAAHLQYLAQYNTLYWLEGNTLHSLELNNGQTNNYPLAVTTAYAMYYIESEDRFYILDAMDFNSSGSVHICRIDGVIEDSFEAGLIPSYALKVD